MTKLDLRQFKLVNSDEIVCEVLEETPGSIIIRNVLKLTWKESNDGYKYFTFSTWMIYQDHPLSVMLLMMNQIIAFAKPTDQLCEEYGVALNAIQDERNKESEAKEADQTVHETSEKIIH